MKQKFLIDGMSCSACSASVEKAVRRVDGVKKAEVSLMNNSMVCEFSGKETEARIIEAVRKAGFSASVAGNRPEKPKDRKSGEDNISLRLVISLVFLVPLMYFSMGHMIGLPLTHMLSMPEYSGVNVLIQLVLATPVLFINRIFFIRGFSAVIRKSPNMDTLVALGATASFCYGLVMTFAVVSALGRGDTPAASSFASNLYFESAAMILTLVTVGKLLEQKAKNKTNSALKKLNSMVPQTVNVIRDGVETAIDASDLRVGDVIVVRPGEIIPADGTVCDGNSSTDRSALTGESMPVDITVGDKVMSACINLDGIIRVQAEKVGTDTALSRIISLVEEAGATKSRYSRLADRISRIFVPVVVSVSALTFAVWLIAGYGFAFALNTAVSVLVISCPCALGLATPVAVTAAVGKSASRGILVKSAEAIEKLSEADVAVFDKTGTITYGKPVVTDVIPYNGIGKDELLLLAASVESGSEHPLSLAVIAACERTLYPLTEFKAVFGRGVEGVVNEKRINGGNPAYMSELGIDTSMLSADTERLSGEGKTPLCFAYDGVAIGVIAVADKVRETSREAMEQLSSLGIKTVMLTGDNPITAAAVASEVGTDEVIAGLMPDDKEKIIDRLQREGHTVIMTGDGINDSPSLMRADIGIAIGKGSDIAVDAADMVLLFDDLNDVVFEVRYSRRTVRNIAENLFWAFFYNVIGIPLAAGALYLPFGILLTPMIASAAMSFSSLFVVCNALRLFADTKKRKVK